AVVVDPLELDLRRCDTRTFFEEDTPLDNYLSSLIDRQDQSIPEIANRTVLDLYSEFHSDRIAVGIERNVVCPGFKAFHKEATLRICRHGLNVLTVQTSSDRRPGDRAAFVVAHFSLDSALCKHRWQKEEGRKQEKKNISFVHRLRRRGLATELVGYIIDDVVEAAGWLVADQPPGLFETGDAAPHIFEPVAVSFFVRDELDLAAAAGYGD